MTYFNTTAEAGAELEAYRDKARTQEERVGAFFDDAAEFLYTPSQVLAEVFPGEAVPLTSVRRAMTVLTEKGRLVKTPTKRIGAFGRPEYCWRRQAKPRQLGLIGENGA